MFDPFGFLAFQLPIQEVRPLQTPPLDEGKVILCSSSIARYKPWLLNHTNMFCIEKY